MTSHACIQGKKNLYWFISLSFWMIYSSRTHVEDPHTFLSKRFKPPKTPFWISLWWKSSIFKIIVNYFLIAFSWHFYSLNSHFIARADWIEQIALKKDYFPNNSRKVKLMKNFHQFYFYFLLKSTLSLKIVTIRLLKLNIFSRKEFWNILNTIKNNETVSRISLDESN